MKTALTCFAALLLAAAALPAHADPTPEQRTQLENCKIMSGAVFEFAQARDRKQSKMDAFKDVTHGQAYVPGSLLDETLQWAYAHPSEQPDTASAHFYGRCVLDTYDARSPDTEGELDIAAQGCQQAHPGVPSDVRDCIQDKAQDIVVRSQTALAAAASTAPAPALAATPTPNAATVVAAAPSPAQASPTPQAVPAAVTTVSVPAAKPALVVPAEPAPSQTVAVAPSQPAAAPAASAAPPPAPQPVPVAPAPIPEPVVVAAPTPVAVVAPAAKPATPASAPQTPAAAPAPVSVPAPAPVVAAAPPPVLPPAPRATPTPPPVPAPVTVVAPTPVVAKAAAPATNLPPIPAATATPSGPPPSLAGYGKLTLGMSMDDAYKAMGSHGDTDWDAQGEVHTYMIGDDHGFIEIRASATGTLYSIRVVGGADAHITPILNVVLGDGAYVLINNVGMPSSRTPLPGDKELWNYLGRNYAFEISPGGDVIGLRIIDTSYAPGAVTGDPAQ